MEQKADEGVVNQPGGAVAQLQPERRLGPAPEGPAQAGVQLAGGSSRGSLSKPPEDDRATKVEAAKKHLLERAEAAVRVRMQQKTPPAAEGSAGGTTLT